MKKFKKPLLIAAGVILTLFLLVFLLLFSAPGNAILKPVVQNLATQKSGMKVELGEFRLRFSNFAVNATINECLGVAAAGNYSIFKQSFSVDFNALAEDLSKFGVTLKQKTQLNGTAVGKADDFNITAGGIFAASPLDAFANLQNFTLKNASFAAPKLDLATLLTLGGQKHYATGALGVEAKIADFKGVARLATNGIKLNTNLVKKDFNLTLDAPFGVNFNSATKLDLNSLFTSTEFKLVTPLATATSKDAKFDLNKTKFEANYTLSVPNLAKLEKLINYKLRGAFKGEGEAVFSAQNGVQASLHSNIFKGRLNAHFDGKNAVAKLSKIRIEELLYTANLQKFYLGEANLNATFNTLSGVAVANADITHGQLAKSKVSEAVKTLFGRDITQEIYKDGKFNASLNGEVAAFNADLKSSKSTILVQNGSLNIANEALSAPLNLTIEKTDINILLGGTTSKMTYKIESDYLKNKAKTKAKKEIDKLIDNKLNLKEEQKSLIKGLFGK